MKGIIDPSENPAEVPEVGSRGATQGVFRAVVGSRAWPGRAGEWARWSAAEQAARVSECCQPRPVGNGPGD